MHNERLICKCNVNLNKYLVGSHYGTKEILDNVFIPDANVTAYFIMHTYNVNYKMHN